LFLFKQIETPRPRDSFVKKEETALTALMKKCWASNPRLRPGFAGIQSELESKFFNDNKYILNYLFYLNQN